MPCFMRLMRSHNLAYFRWFLEHKKSRLHIAVQTRFHAYSGNIKCVLCDRIKRLMGFGLHRGKIRKIFLSACLRSNL